MGRGTNHDSRASPGSTGSSDDATAVPTGPSSVPHIPKASTSLDGLTALEVEVLRLVAQGLTDAQVAEQLNLGRLFGSDIALRGGGHRFGHICPSCSLRCWPDGSILLLCSISPSISMAFQRAT